MTKSRNLATLSRAWKFSITN